MAKVFKEEQEKCSIIATYYAIEKNANLKPDDESDKPYSERSKANRMKDPKRGINSPAFKKFMASQGM